MLKAQRLPVPPLALGEGPMWHSGRNTLFFVDICSLESAQRYAQSMSMQDGSPRYSICRTTSACGSMMQNATRMDGCLLD